VNVGRFFLRAAILGRIGALMDVECRRFMKKGSARPSDSNSSSLSDKFAITTNAVVFP